MWRQQPVERFRGGTDCHGRKDTTDRTDAGTERGGSAFSGASRLASAEGARATSAAQTPAGTDRKTKARAGRVEPATRGVGTRPHRNDGQTHAFAGGARARSLRRAKTARAVARHAREFRATFG